MLEPGLHYEWLVRSLCDVVVPRPVVLALQTQQLFACLLAGVDLLDDPRVRRLELERANPTGSWTIVSAHAFADIDGKSAPFKRETHPPGYNGGTSEGDKRYRARSKP